MTRVLGIHHITAVAGDARRTLDFYSGFLGMRLVKRTVNFDDPSTYHLYFGDESATPGTLLTFFVQPGAPRGQIGAGQVATISLSISMDALGFWIERMIRFGVRYQGPLRRNGGGRVASVLSFSDPDGLLLQLTAHMETDGTSGRSETPGQAQWNAIRGIESATMWLEEHDDTERLLIEELGMRLVDVAGTTRLYGIHGATHPVLAVRSVGGFLRGTSGPGTVHHIAWRAGSESGQLELRKRLEDAGTEPTEVIDRRYFSSVYFREPGGALFELATDAPGFTVDETAAQLGSSLQLPEHLEPLRPQIESVLPDLPG